MTKKIETGDFNGAIWLASTEDTIADFDDATYSALLSKHPAPHSHICVPSVPPTPVPILLSPRVIRAAIQSFPNGSVGGLENLKTQHLNDLVQGMETVDDSPFLIALMDFCSMVLHGDFPAEVRPLFLARLLALCKKTGVFRPIAVGCMLCC